MNTADGPSGLAPKPLAGQVAIVTGAGRGLGRAHAIELAARGAAVVVNDVAGASAKETVEAIVARGGTARVSDHDVTDSEAGRALVADTVADYGSLEILINNAGILRAGYLEDLSRSDYDEVLDMHLRAVFQVTAAAWPIMMNKRYGRVLMTSSSAGMFGWPGACTYSAAKGGVYGLTKALAFEGIEFGINVNVVLPWAASQMGDNNPVPDLRRNYDYFVGEDLPRDHWRQDPTLTARLAAYLVDPSCQLSGEAYSSCRGRFARVFVGVTDGWVAPELDTSVEAIAAHIDQIRDLAHWSVPQWVFDELAIALRQAGVPTAGRRDDSPSAFLPRSVPATQG